MQEHLLPSKNGSSKSNKFRNFTKRSHRSTSELFGRKFLLIFQVYSGGTSIRTEIAHRSLTAKSKIYEILHRFIANIFHFCQFCILLWLVRALIQENYFPLSTYYFTPICHFNCRFCHLYCQFSVQPNNVYESEEKFWITFVINAFINLPENFMKLLLYSFICRYWSSSNLTSKNNSEIIVFHTIALLAKKSCSSNIMYK